MVVEQRVKAVVDRLLPEKCQDRAPGFARFVDSKIFEGTRCARISARTNSLRTLATGSSDLWRVEEVVGACHLQDASGTRVAEALVPALFLRPPDRIEPHVSRFLNFICETTRLHDVQRLAYLPKYQINQTKCSE